MSNGSGWCHGHPQALDLMIVRHRDDQDGADAAADLRADARPQVGGLDGIVRELRWSRSVTDITSSAGVDRVIPVDACSGMPATTESLLNGLLLLQDQISHFRRTGKARRTNLPRSIDP